MIFSAIKGLRTFLKWLLLSVLLGLYLNYVGEANFDVSINHETKELKIRNERILGILPNPITIKTLVTNYKLNKNQNGLMGLNNDKPISESGVSGFLKKNGAEFPFKKAKDIHWVWYDKKIPLAQNPDLKIGTPSQGEYDIYCFAIEGKNIFSGKRALKVILTWDYTAYAPVFWGNSVYNDKGIDVSMELQKSIVDSCAWKFKAISMDSIDIN